MNKINFKNIITILIVVILFNINLGYNGSIAGCGDKYDRCCNGCYNHYIRTGYSTECYGKCWDRYMDCDESQYDNTGSYSYNEKYLTLICQVNDIHIKVNPNEKSEDVYYMGFSPIYSKSNKSPRVTMKGELYYVMGEYNGWIKIKLNPNFVGCEGWVIKNSITDI